MKKRVGIDPECKIFRANAIIPKKVDEEFRLICYRLGGMPLKEGVEKAIVGFVLANRKLLEKRRPYQEVGE